MEEADIKNSYMRYSKLDIDDNVIFFIEDYLSGSYGFVYEMFADILKSKKYEDFKFVWTVRNRSAFKEAFSKSFAEDERLSLVDQDSDSYIKFLCTAKTIISGVVMPNYFIKRVGQLLHWIPTNNLLSNDKYTSQMLKLFVPTINNIDRLFLDKNMVNISRFVSDYCISENKIEMINAGQKELVTTNKKPFFLFSFLNADHTAGNPDIFDYVYDVTTMLAAEYGIEVQWKISLTLMKKLKKKKDGLKNYKNIVSNELFGFQMFKEASIVVTDTVTEASKGVMCDKKTLLFYNKEIDEKYNKILRKVFITSDFETLIWNIECSLSKIFSDTGTILKKSPLLFDCPQMLRGQSDTRVIDDTYCVNERSMIGKEKKNKTIKTLLIVLDAYDDIESMAYLNEFLLKENQGKNLTILFKDSNNAQLYTLCGCMSAKIKYTCRTAGIMCTSEEKARIIAENVVPGDTDMKHVIDREWIRIVGMVRYDRMIAVKGKGVLWKNLYKYPPAEEVQFIEHGKVWDVIKKIKELIS